MQVRSTLGGDRSAGLFYGSRLARGMGIACIHVLTLWAAGCSTRDAGQVELFGVKTVDNQKILCAYQETPANAARSIAPVDGDPIRANDDVVTIQVETMFLQHISTTLTGSHDIIVFSDVWENAATGYDSPSLTSIIYIGKNQLVPGKLNFRDALAYGPIDYKGHPLRLRLTVMVLQKDPASREASAIDVISTIVSTAKPETAIITGSIAKGLEDLLKAQPDVVTFDFEVTLLSDHPEGLTLTALDQKANAQGGTADVNKAGGASTVSGGFLHYGELALVETRAHSAYAMSIDPLNPPMVVANGGLRCPRKDGSGEYTPNYPHSEDGSANVNYAVLRITPGQRSESNQLIASAATANQTLINKLRTSDAEIAAALGDIKEQAKAITGSLLKARAESLASSIVTSAEAKARKKLDATVQGVLDAGLAALNDPTTGFTKRWTDETKHTDPEAKAAEVGAAVLAEWQTRLQNAGASSSPTTQPSTPSTPLNDATSQGKFTQALKNKTVTSNNLTFKVALAELSQSAGADFDTLTVTLEGPANPSGKAKKDLLKDEIKNLAQKTFESKFSSNAVNTIKKVDIKNESDLVNVLE